MKFTSRLFRSNIKEFNKISVQYRLTHDCKELSIVCFAK